MEAEVIVYQKGGYLTPETGEGKTRVAQRLVTLNQQQQVGP